MATVDERFHVRNGGLLRRLWRDLRLLWYLAGIAWRWFRAGGRIRRAYLRANATGQVVHIDDLSGRGKYD